MNREGLLRLRRREIERLADMPWIRREDGTLEALRPNFAALEALDKAIAEYDSNPLTEHLP